MLYDPKWQKTKDTKFFGMTLSGLVSWLTTMPPERAYDFCDDSTCLLAEYRVSLGNKRMRVRLPEYRGMNASTPGEVFQNIVLPLPWTYGAALERARAALAAV